MDQQANDCPCKRLRVSEGDEVDQETGMVQHAAVGPDENTENFERVFQQGDATPRESDKSTFQRDITAVDNTFTGASGDSENKFHLSQTGSLTEKEAPDLLRTPKSSGDGAQSTSGSNFEVNQSTGNSVSEECVDNQSASAFTGSNIQSVKTEADIMSCGSNLHQLAGNEFKGRQLSGVCDFVKNVQAMAENSYIKTRERNASQNEPGRVPSLESPKLKRTRDRVNTNIVKQRMELSSNLLSKPSAGSQLKLFESVVKNSELKNPGPYVEHSSESDKSHPGTTRPFDSGTTSPSDLAESDRNENRGAADSRTCSETVATIHTPHKGCDESDATEQNEKVLKDSGQQCSVSDLADMVTMVTSDAGTGTSRSCDSQSNSNVRFIPESLDDSGFIEMFSNSVMGNILCGNGGSYRNSGRKGTWRDSGNSDKNSNMTSDKNSSKSSAKDRFRIKGGESTANVTDGVRDDRRSASERNNDDSSEACKFGELGDLFTDIGQQEEHTSNHGNTLTRCQHETVSESTEQATDTDQGASGSTSNISETTSLYFSNISVPRRVREKVTEATVSANYLGMKVELPDRWVDRNLNTKCPSVSSLVNGRFKLDFEQTQEIICQSDINSLPITVLVHIFKSLTVFKLLCRVSLVCKYWYNTCRDPDIWRNISLVNQHRLSDLDLQRVLSFSDYRVRNVNLTDCRFVTNQGVKNLVLNCPHIEVLKVMRCFDLTDVAFKGLYSLGLCGSLRALYMDGCCRITDNTVQEVSEACAELRILHLNQCTRISDGGIINVAQKCPRLTDLQLDHCSQVTDEGISEIVLGCPNMQYLNLMCCGITDTGVKYLAKLSKLTNLDLSNIPRLTSDSVVYLSKFCGNIQCINVSLNTVMDDQCISQLARNLPALKRLYCVSCSISDNGLEDLAKYRPTLEALDVGWCQEVTDHGVRVISLACKHLDYFGLIRCDRVTIETIEELVLKYPKINYSTFILESRRLLERARNEGYQFSLPLQ